MIRDKGWEDMEKPRRVSRSLPAFAWSAWSAGTSFVYTKCTSAEIVAFEGSNRFISFIFVRHFNETKTAEATCFFIINEFN